MQANTPVNIDVEFNWTNEEASADWSLTIWAENGTVSVRHSNPEITTQHLPVLERQTNDSDDVNTPGLSGNASGDVVNDISGGDNANDNGNVNDNQNN